ncbi:MAG: hypothetical protein ASARMPREDX12_002274 [Alectoria sarmentosa]|nr:MAG: hypothetical protein ASARMPREDX12_002274 [Alectoria sarmentosa]
MAAHPEELIKPAARISGFGNDVWTMVNSAAAASSIQPIANLVRFTSGYNPPQFLIDAAQEALTKVDCNQYSPTRGRPRLKKALADTYSPMFGRVIDPVTEISITTGANEGMLSAIMAFVEPGEEVICFEPFFDQYIRNIHLASAIVKYVPFIPPSADGRVRIPASEWTLDMQQVRQAISPRTKMMIINTPHNPIGKVFSRGELLALGELCVQHSIIILSDEVYDRLSYVPFTRISTLSPEIEARTLTVGSVGKAFYATGWRVGFLIGPASLINHVSTAHTRICFATPGPQQEAAAVGYEEADSRGFWEESRMDMMGKMARFNAVWEELGLPYIDPQGGYFVLVNTSRVKIPASFAFPPEVEERSRDFKLSWFLIKELGVAAIPPADFYSPENAHLSEDYLRFAVCKNDDLLELAKQRLRGLKKYMDD